MSVLNEKTAWRLAAGGAAILAAVLARKALKSAWRMWMDSDPPDDPADPAVSWKEAVAWTAVTGAVVGVARLLATRAAASGFRRVTGHVPPA